MASGLKRGLLFRCLHRGPRSGVGAKHAAPATVSSQKIYVAQLALNVRNYLNDATCSDSRHTAYPFKPMA